MGWEYLVKFHFLTLDDQERDSRALQSYLSDMGKGGWELVSLLPIPEEDRKNRGRSIDVNYVFTFKRPRKA